MNYISGIGSRETPSFILEEMNIIGVWCKEQGIIIRSGHAPGADQAFETADEYCIAYLPWSNFEAQFISKAKLVVYEQTPEIIALARKFHPKYDYLKSGAKKLMERNGCQVLGPDLNIKSQAVVCWTEGAKGGGGTGQAIRIAKAYGIPVIDMAKPELSKAEDAVAVLKTIISV